jgi:hypothetical protein
MKTHIQKLQHIPKLEDHTENWNGPHRAIVPGAAAGTLKDLTPGTQPACFPLFLTW